MTEHSFNKVAVLYGGDSAEREVSLKSGQAVYAALCAAGVNAIAVDTKDTPVHQLAQQGVDCAFIMLHGRGGEDGTIQGALKTLGIPFTGSDVLSSALAMDKIRTKQIWQSLGLPTAVYRQVCDQHRAQLDHQQLINELGGVVFVKPAQEGSSVGMAKVSDASALESAINYALEYDESVLLESFVDGEEYTVAILDNQPLPAIRLHTPREFYDYQAKYQATSTEYHCPSGLNDADEQQLRDIALAAYRAIGCSGWGRVDIMRDRQGNFFLLEVNTVPGMTEKSLVPMAAKQIGLSFQGLVVNILASVG